MKTALPLGLLLLCSAALSCARKSNDAAGKLLLFVSIPPQASFAERIVADRADVRVLVPQGQTPHAYDPTPRQVTELGRARLFFRARLPFEGTLLDKIAGAHEGLEIVDITEGIPLRNAGPDGCTGCGGDHGEHAGHEAGKEGGEEKDPHTWLNPRYALIQARNMTDALCRVDPDGAADYQRNFGSLEADLKALDGRVAEVLAPLRGSTFYVYHPAFGYFAEAYGLTQKAVEIEGKSPGPRHLKELVEKALEEGVSVIFVQPQFSTKAAEAVAEEIGGAVVPIDPLARDYIPNLEAMARTIRQAFIR
jgi:zinc transport system substrate-binding protein